MSSLPNYSPLQSFNIDHSHHKTLYGGYTNLGCNISGPGGTINVTHQHLPRMCSFPSPLETLEKYCSFPAAFDSSAHFNAPRCCEFTRLRIIQTIEEWINDNTAPSSLFWLHGGPRVGKSALAQTLCDKFQETNQLAASFFFCRHDPFRNNGNHLIPTLASHFLETFEGVGPFVEERILKNRALFHKKYQVQMRALLVDPLLSLKSKGAQVVHPRLIVIDALDECQDPNIQAELIRVIARAIPLIPYPLRFLVTSRPEVHIARVFNDDCEVDAITIRRHNLSHPGTDRHNRRPPIPQYFGESSHGESNFIDFLDQGIKLKMKACPELAPKNKPTCSVVVGDRPMGNIGHHPDLFQTKTLRRANENWENTSEKIIACIGPVGSGKSRIIDCLAKTKWASNTLAVGTREIRSTKIKVAGGTVVLVDTPGFATSPLGVVQQIERWLNKNYKNDVHLTAVLYLHPISDDRMTQLTSEILKRLLGPDNPFRVALVTTMWNETRAEIAEEREIRLHALYWREMLDLGAHANRFDNTEGTAWQILDQLLGTSVEKIIVCLGPIGSGKSRLIDCLAQTKWASNSLACGTTEIRSTKIRVRNGAVVLVDTPGFDTSPSDGVQQVERWLNKNYKNNLHLTGILYLHPISDNRMTKLSPEDLKRLLEPEDSCRVVLVTTMWNETRRDVAEERETKLHALCWKEMLDLGAHTNRFDNEETTAWRIIDQLLGDVSVYK